MMRKGFTLVELLVVIAVISVLAAMLLPVMRSAVASARLVVCMNNQKQLGMAFLDYAQSNRGFYPPMSGVHTAGASTFSSYRWNDWLKPYFNMEPTSGDWGDWGVGTFDCPEVADLSSNKRRFTANGKWCTAWYSSYNPQVALDDYIKYSQSRNWTYTRIIIVDGSDLRTLNPFEDYVSLRHSNTADYLFSDGHVESNGTYHLLDWSANDPW